MTSHSGPSGSVLPGHVSESGQGDEAVTGGNSNSPLKAIRVSAFYTNLEPDLGQAKQELRDTMRGKSHSLDPNSFMGSFFPLQSPPSTASTAIPNIFKDAPVFRNEKQMYKCLVSTI